MPSSSSSSSSSSSLLKEVVIIDNGASTIRVCRISHTNKSSTPPTPVIETYPNLIARTRNQKVYVADQIHSITDYGSLHLRSPHDRGVVTDWAVQKTIWDQIFRPNGTKNTLQGKTVVITESYFAFQETQESLERLLFDEYLVAAIYRTTPAELARYAVFASLDPIHPIQKANAQIVTTGKAKQSWSDIPTSFATAFLSQLTKKTKKPECMLVLDAGYSYTHAIPIVQGKVYWSAVKRLDLGGKMLTNWLKEMLSFRQWDMMEETFLTNVIRERCCFVAPRSAVHDPSPRRHITSKTDSNEWSFPGLVELCRHQRPSPLCQEYCLPDFTSTSRSTDRFGYIRKGPKQFLEADWDHPLAFPSSMVQQGHDEEEEVQILKIDSERFQIPEAIFDPNSSLFIDQSGLPLLALQAIQSLPPEYQEIMFSNIVTIGGLFQIPGMYSRLKSELIPLCPSDVPLQITTFEEPQTCAIQGAIHLVLFEKPSTFASKLFTRQEYLSHGAASVVSQTRFDSWSVTSSDHVSVSVL